MKTLSIIAVGAVTIAGLTNPAAAIPFGSLQAIQPNSGLIQLAQNRGDQGFGPNRRTVCDQPGVNCPGNPGNGAGPSPNGRRSLNELLLQQQSQSGQPQADEQPQAQEQPQVEEQPQQAEKPRRKRDRQQPEQPQQAEQPAQPQQVEQPRQAEQPRRRRDRQQVEQTRPPRQEAPMDRDLVQMMRDNRPAGALTDAELRRYIEQYARILQSGRLDGRMDRRVRASLEDYNSELERRISATAGRDVGRIDAQREARRILQDDRPASRMKDDQLRERINDTRTVLALPGLDPRFEDRLREQLVEDRQELRSRVARVEQPNRRQQFNNSGRQVDRRVLRRDMFEAREERRRRLNDPNYRIVVPNRAVRSRAPMPTIALAEAYDEQLVDQLMAPPAYPIDRRYTIDEYRANPALRTLMPGIEIDTVKFGFNEDFLREEEIIKLDRIGEVMERIIAGNPNEVFLIEGHTDLVGSETYNEDLSWRRADAVRQALSEFYYIPRENLEIVGYGEQYPRIPIEADEPENRRVTVRRITPILYGQR